MQLATSAFLASAAACTNLINQIVTPNIQGNSIPYFSDALAEWSHGHHLSPPIGSNQQQQTVWDTLKVSLTAKGLVESAPDERSHAHLLAACSKESGVWLHALPVSFLGLKMDKITLRIAVGLRLGATLCHLHICHHCGTEVD